VLDAHESYLWGSGAWCAALLMGQVFTQQGWSASFAAAGDVGGLPMATWREGGESMSKPIAEAWLSDRATGAISERGLIPITSIQHRDAVRVGPLRSIATDGVLRVRSS
jgi:predicted component of type VI protein secretion system